MEINKEKLTFMGSMNYVVQAYKNEDGTFNLNNYMPRKNRERELEGESAEDAKQKIEETIERMKIAINMFQELLEGKREYVYYWDLDKEN